MATSLTNGSFNAYVYSVYVSGLDIYAAGFENNATKAVAKIWKNGVPTLLSDGTNSARAYSVYGSGTDVYVGGYENDGTKNIAKLWKNGVLIPLQNSATAGFVAGVFVK